MVSALALIDGLTTQALVTSVLGGVSLPYESFLAVRPRLNVWVSYRYFSMQQHDASTCSTSILFPVFQAQRWHPSLTRGMLIIGKPLDRKTYSVR